MKIIMIFLCMLVSSCTLYTEKQSESVSQNTYAVNSSLEKARVDLAWFYSNETLKFIKPPKHPIIIESVYQISDTTVSGNVATNSHIAIMPSTYSDKKAIAVGTQEYQELLKDSRIKKQIEKDSETMRKQSELNRQELVKQSEMRDKMVADLNHLQAEVYKKDAIIWKLVAAIIVLLVIMGGYLYLRFSKLLPF